MDAAESLGAISRMHGTARKEVSPHRPIAPGTYGSPLPPSEIVVSGAFFMRWVRQARCLPHGVWQLVGMWQIS